MSIDIEDALRRGLGGEAPATSPTFDWETLRGRSRRRMALRRGAATAVGGSLLATALVVTSPWSADPVEVGPAISSPSESGSPVSETSQQPSTTLAPAVIDEAIGFARDLPSTWDPASTGPAVRGTLVRALETLMSSPHVVDRSAQPQVIWSSGGQVGIAESEPTVVVGVEQPAGWVIGFWGPRRQVEVDADGPMAFATMAAGPIRDRVVGVQIQDRLLSAAPGRVALYVPPVAAVRMVRIDTGRDAEFLGVPPGTESEIDIGVEGVSFFDSVTLRAYAADGTVLDEQVYAK